MHENGQPANNVTLTESGIRLPQGCNGLPTLEALMGIVVETIGTHTCTGYADGVPPLVRRFAEESGAEVEYRVYRAWDLG